MGVSFFPVNGRPNSSDGSVHSGARTSHLLGLPEMLPRNGGERMLVIVFLALLRTGPSLAFILDGGVRSFGPTRRTCASSDDAGPTVTRDSAFVIPIFPLRKTIKLPGESLTLNLYEERYLELAEWILQVNRMNAAQRVFGALYASDKPQIVSKQGMGPIVPMIRPGDIGVIFSVDHHEEGMIPTNLRHDLRRRIRIDGTGIARFRIEKILHDGYGGGDDVKNGTDALPFILAQVSLYCDDQEGNGDQTSSLAVVKNRLGQLWSQEEMKSLSTRAKAIGIPEAIMQAEFQSFLLASPIIRDGLCDERKKMLISRSTKDRLQFLLQAQEEN